LPDNLDAAGIEDASTNRWVNADLINDRSNQFLTPFHACLIPCVTKELSCRNRIKQGPSIALV
jgi:hypothetical protein